MTGNYGQQGRGNVSLFSVISTPIIIIVLATALLIYNLIGLIGVLVNGGEIVYEEEALNSYISTTYDNSFKKSSAKNSGIVLMFFYNEDTNALEYTVKAGSNVSTYASAVFGTDSKFGSYLEKNLKMENYKATVGDTLAAAIDQMAKEIEDLKLMSNYVYEHDVTNMPKPEVIIKKGAGDVFSQENADKITAALERFQAETGLYMVMSLDTSVNAFGRTIPTTDILMVVLIVAVIGLCTFNLVKKIREYNRIKNDFGGQEQTRIRVNARSPYYDEDDEDEEAPATEEDAEEEEPDEEIFEEEETSEAEGIVAEDIPEPQDDEEKDEEEKPAPRKIIKADIFNSLANEEESEDGKESEEGDEDDEDLESDDNKTDDAEAGLDYDVEYDEYDTDSDDDYNADKIEASEDSEEINEDDLDNE